MLVPAADTRSCRRTMRMLLPEMAGRPRQIRPPCGSVIRYAMFPFWACLLVPAAAAAACRLFPDWQQLIVFLGLMLALPFVWLLILRMLHSGNRGFVAAAHPPLFTRIHLPYGDRPAGTGQLCPDPIQHFPEMGRQL